MLNVNKSDIIIITIQNVDYGCIIHSIGRCKAINFLRNYVHEDPGFI